MRDNSLEKVSGNKKRLYQNIRVITQRFTKYSQRSQSSFDIASFLYISFIKTGIPVLLQISSAYL